MSLSSVSIPGHSLKLYRIVTAKSSPCIQFITVRNKQFNILIHDNEFLRKIGKAGRDTAPGAEISARLRLFTGSICSDSRKCAAMTPASARPPSTSTAPSSTWPSPSVTRTSARSSVSPATTSRSWNSMKNSRANRIPPVPRAAAYHLRRESGLKRLSFR